MSTDVNVKVAVRCRPMSSRETQMGAHGIVEVLDGKTIVIRPRAAGDSDSAEAVSGKKQFTFDHAYGTDSTQSQVYDDIARPTVEKALQGYNGTIFAYGQTGSGKTHTMMGSGDDIGIVPLMNVDIFRRVAEAQAAQPALQFLVTVSFLEIYNEVIKDLLNPSDKLLKIREHPDMGIYVEQLAELVVKDAGDVARLLEQGNKVRQVAATQMNERSSRSHSCFTVKIASKRAEELPGGVRKEVTMTAKINLVDLAGSERASKTGATGDRLKEGAAINKSLSALGNVINMLASKGASKAHVPYRDSKLTRLLQESLGGNALTVMVAAISPADYNVDESMSTLLYASRAKAIKNATRKNEDVNERIIRELREEIERLRQMVARPSSAAASDTQPQSQQQQPTREMTTQMEEVIANLERAKQQSWDEQQRLTELYEHERAAALANETKILGFMQTVKQEKMDIVKRVKALQQRKTQLARAVRQRRQTYVANKSKLQADVDAFQATAAGLAPPAKQRLMDAIEACKALVLEDRDAMARLKDELQACEDKLVEEEAEVAAKTALLEEDDKLRKAIQDDERAKMQCERAHFLQVALEDERRQFQREAEDDKQKLHLALGATIDKEKKLLDEVERQRARALAFQQQLRHAHVAHAEQQRETHAALTHMLAALQQDFAVETRAQDAKFAYVVALLRGARNDIVALAERNRELEAKLRELTMWEKTW